MTRHNWISLLVLAFSALLLLTIIVGCAPRYEPPGRDLWKIVPK